MTPHGMTVVGMMGLQMIGNLGVGDRVIREGES